MQDDAAYWVVTACADHAGRGRVEGIIQANHGKEAPLKRLRPGDGVVIYSPRLSYPDGDALQAFTQIGRIATGDPFAAGTMWRRAVDWQAAVVSAPIRPLLDQLEITRGLPNWGAAFRFGLTRLSRADFARISGAMLG